MTQLTSCPVATELQERLAGLEAELEQRSGHVSGLTAQLEQTAAEKSQLEQRVASITALLEASEGKGAEGVAPQVC